MIDWQSKQLGQDGEILLFELSGRLDSLQCDYLLNVIEHRIKRDQKKLIIDCNDLEYISSMGLGMLLRIHSRMKKRDGDVKLACVHGVVADAFKIVMLDRAFNMYPSVQAAVDSYG